MEKFFKVFTVFFVPVKSYGEMLTKLAVASFFQGIFIAFLLEKIPLVEKLVSKVDVKLPHVKILAQYIGEDIHFTTANVILGIVLSVGLSHMLQFHNKISNVLKIRERFDIANIILPLAVMAGAQLTAQKLIDLRSDKRHSLMRQIFYKYCSSELEHPLVDKHEIYQALTAWSWFWIPVEAAAFAMTGAIVSFAWGAYAVAAIFIYYLCAALLWAILAYNQLGSKVRPEVEAIAADPVALSDVKNAINAL